MVIRIALMALILASSAEASDGRTEINQTSIDAAGGFPFTIGAPGNFLLTSDLTVPASTDGIVLAANDVTLDLNGFSISSQATCSSGSCVAGPGSGISVAGPSIGDRVTVRNGAIRGFANICITLGTQARVESLLVAECGNTGIQVQDGSVVLGNRVTQTGLTGIHMAGTDPPPTYAHNTTSQSSLFVSGFFGVLGGRASAGNSCDDGSCSPNGQRRFYLTENEVNGGMAAAECAFGFRVADLTELWDLSNLYYDPTKSSFDRLVHGFEGWLYRGFHTDHCDDFTSTGASGWHGAVFTSMPTVAPWEINISIPTSCTAEFRVWCIER